MKESAADLATRTANLVHTTRAFEHGEAAFGARFVKPGFARTPEDDLAFALGWPHIRSLIEGHPNDRITNEAQIEKVVFAPQVGLAVPREIALRRIRAFSSFANSPDGKLRPGALRAMQNRDPMTEEQAQTFVLEHLAGRSLGTKQLEVVFLLEAVAGPEAIAEAITTAFEKTQDAQLLDHAVDKSTWAFAVGFLLLRARTDVSLALRDRLKAIIARCPRHDVNKSSVANVLDQVLHQNAATLRSDPTDQSLLLHWVDQPPASVRRELDGKVRPFGGSVYARMVYLGGDDVIEYYMKQFDKVKDAVDQRAIVAQFGRIASPKIRELVELMAEKSKAEKDARLWLDANRGY